MQSTGHTSTQEVSLVPMQGSPMMWGIHASRPDPGTRRGSGRGMIAPGPRRSGHAVGQVPSVGGFLDRVEEVGRAPRVGLGGQEWDALGRAELLEPVEDLDLRELILTDGADRTLRRAVAIIQVGVDGAAVGGDDEDPFGVGLGALALHLEDDGPRGPQALLLGLVFQLARVRAGSGDDPAPAVYRPAAAQVLTPPHHQGIL